MDYIIFTTPLPLGLFAAALAAAIVSLCLEKYNFIAALICALCAAAGVICSLVLSVPLSEIFTCLLIILLALFAAIALRGGKR